jgi:HD-GYP domain-containing protein (c-di-GMP phosphodiesterase class II)
MVLLRTTHIRVEESLFSPGGVPLSQSALAELKATVRERLLMLRNTVMIRNTGEHPNLRDFPPLQLLAHPIMLDSGEIAGGLILFRDAKKREFSRGDMRLLRMLAGHASIMAINHDLYDDMKQLLFSMVQSLSDAIEAKDSYTRGHTQRVSEISVALGEALSLPSQGLENLRWASILHDVGKIGIPESILCKPARLTAEEYEVMKKHPEIGYQIMNHIVPLREALTGVLHHHERFDGKGYPKGLKGNEIPLYGRILSVADTYDSMTSTRSYRQARTHEFAVEEIRRVSGEQLDPDIVLVFMEMAQNNREFLCKILGNAKRHASESSPSLSPNSP